MKAIFLYSKLVKCHKTRRESTKPETSKDLIKRNELRIEDENNEEEEKNVYKVIKRFNYSIIERSLFFRIIRLTDIIKWRRLHSHSTDSKLDKLREQISSFRRRLIMNYFNNEIAEYN